VKARMLTSRTIDRTLRVPRTRQRRSIGIALIAAVLVACSSAPQPAGIGVATAEPGPFLVDRDGRSLYLFTADEPGRSTCVDACLAAWPAALTDGAPEALAGVDPALLGTITRADGTVQVTYADRPLYRYAADTAAGSAAGQGVGGVWFLVGPDGAGIGLPVPEAATPPAEAPSSGGYEY
jgi:predicted lipoprotein with Yx(FWY)xxD motif